VRSRAHKVRGVVALALAALTAAACTTTASGGTGGGSSACLMGSAACANAADQASCLSCNEMACMHGAALLQDLVDCLFCTACYNVCSSGQNGACGDAGAPAQTDPCDKGTPSTPGAGTTCGNQSGGCVFCAQQPGHTCETQRNNCNNDQDCLTFNDAILKCPAN
jgi:hypothetical protein